MRGTFLRSWLVLGLLAGPAAVAAPAAGSTASEEAAERCAQGRRSRRQPEIEHDRVRKQLFNNPVPLFLTVREDLAATTVELFYRVRGEDDYLSLLFAPWTTGGWYTEIPCSMVQPTRWEYYIVVYDAAGEELATEASARRPHRVEMVQRLSEPPLRPDGTPVEACNPDGSPPIRMPDCPPGMVCGGTECRGCDVSTDCALGEECFAGCCQPSAEPVELPPQEEPYDPVGMFLRVSGGVGAGVINGIVDEWAWYVNPLSGDLIYGPDNVIEQFDAGTQLVLGGGVVRLELGWFPIPELSLSVLGRVSFPFGDEFPWLVELRGTWWFRFGEDHRLGVFLGGGAGRMAHKLERVSFVQLAEFPGAMICPPDTRLRCRNFSPYWWSSGWGTVGFGAQYVYLFTHWFGLTAELAFNPMFPEFSFNMDFDAGVYFAF
jgi:hypothetical protein